MDGKASISVSLRVEEDRGTRRLTNAKFWFSVVFPSFQRKLKYSEHPNFVNLHYRDNRLDCCWATGIMLAFRRGSQSRRAAVVLVVDMTLVTHPCLELDLCLCERTLASAFLDLGPRLLGDHLRSRGTGNRKIMSGMMMHGIKAKLDGMRLKYSIGGVDTYKKSTVRRNQD